MRAINQPSRKHRRQIDFTADSFIGIVFQFSVQCAQKREPFIKHNENIMLFAATHVHAREYLRGHTSRSRLSCSPGRKTKYTLEYIHRRRWGSRKKKLHARTQRVDSLSRRDVDRKINAIRPRRDIEAKKQRWRQNRNERTD